MARRKINNGMARKAARREAAAERRDDRARRSDTDQVASLEARGHGDCKEATRLRAAIAEAGA